jgi:hypothetical protein
MARNGRAGHRAVQADALENEPPIEAASMTGIRARFSMLHSLTPPCVRFNI